MLVCLICSHMEAQTRLVGPHQGTLKAAGKYMIELFGCSDHMEIYVFTKDLQATSNVGITGEVQFFDGKNTVVAQLVLYGRDGFAAKLPTTEFDSCSVGISMPDGRITAEFPSECPINY